MKINGQFDEQLDNNLLSNITDLYKRVEKDNEFEFMFFKGEREMDKMSMEQFLKLLEYINYKGKIQKLRIENTVGLDISYNSKKGESYRITIDGVQNINKYIEMLHRRKNHVVFSVLAGLTEKDENIKIIKKAREKENVIDIRDFEMRVRLSEETKLDKKELETVRHLKETTQESINFRYKQRVSLFVEDNKDVTIRIDLTNVKMTDYINRIESGISNYELEIELVPFTGSPNKKYLDKIYSEITVLLKIIQQSNFIMTKSMEHTVIEHYKQLSGLTKEIVSLDARKAQSLEIQHVVDHLPNKFAVTDKADGERYFLIIRDNHVFLMSENLHVKNTGLEIKKKEYNDSILDGEYIFISKLNRHMYMAFDCLFSGGKDMRNESSLLIRQTEADRIINACFILSGQKGFDMKDYDGKYDEKSIITFHAKQIKDFMGTINNDMQIEKQYPLIRRKYFISVFGAQSNEIFKYSALLWKLYVLDKETKCPYILDGLIYHPIDQKYITSVRESKYVEYKWKPEDKNSIDFYIMFEKNRETGKILTLYDNSDDEKLVDKPYKIVHLYVGKTIRDREQPVLFEPEVDSIKHTAHLFLVDGETRDQQGNILQDRTVVEFYYNNDSELPNKHRWIPIRTRYDKTESVQRFGTKYGNYQDIAYRIWRSIKNPFTMDDISILADNASYEKHNEILRGKIDHSVILSERKENLYYQIKTTLGKPMRNFHNWIKSILIYTHVNPAYEYQNKKLSVLDIACGRGGDIMKFYYGEVDFYVGFDIVNESLISPIDGAVSRYNQLRKTHPNFPRMFFVNADGGALLNYEDQNKALGGMSPKNKAMIEQFFSSDKSKRIQFDRLNCQFALHYFLANEFTWSNFLQNINDCSKPGSYMVVTTFDAERIMELLKDKNQYTAYYTNTSGEQKVMFEIVKKYENIKIGDRIGVGHAIDFHNALDFQEGVYVSEYLVQKDFIKEEFLKYCDMELIETDLFDNQYQIHKDYFLNSIQYEDKDETRTFLKNVQEYYTQKSDVNTACYQMTRLYRYYILRKKDTNVTRKNIKSSSEETKKENEKENEKEARKETKKEKITVKGKKNKNQKGGDSEESIDEIKEMPVNNIPFDKMKKYFDSEKYVMRNTSGDNKYSFMMALHNILQNEGVIPSSTGVNEFCKDIGINTLLDKNISRSSFSKLNKHLNISHTFTDSNMSSENMLSGVNVILIKDDAISSFDKFDEKIPTMMIYYDGNKYYPIYNINKDRYVGMFNSKSKLINDILKN